MYEQIYNLTSMFFKSLKGNLMYEFLISKFNGKRGPQRKLSLEQIVALNIYRFHFKTGDLKNYHKMIKELMSDKVPNLPNYENFMKATNKSTVFILAFMNFLMAMNRKKESEIHYMDSTPITVCMNHKIYSHKVTKSIAKRSKSTKGWWYGFKMSGICNEYGDFENIIFSYANIADCKIAEKLAEVVKGTIFADAGYLQKKDVLKRMEEKGIKFEAAPRKNMNRLMSRFECYHIKHRSIIESDWGTLKNNFQLEYHKARSIVGMFRHFFYSIAAYMINRNLDFYQNFFRLRLI